jgi:hypothetical protein
MLIAPDRITAIAFATLARIANVEARRLRGLALG